MVTRDPNLTPFEALIIPNDALERGGIEILRAAIIDGQLHVTLRRTFEHPDPWGGLLSEVARRVARIYAADGTLDEGEVVFRIHSSFVSESSVRSSRPKKSTKKGTAKGKKSSKKRRTKRGRR
ncbi:MAG TPA: DUF5076 domain-containing protein [Xanthobacteraceae bacterium]